MADSAQKYQPGWLDSVLAVGTMGMLFAPEVRPWTEIFEIAEVGARLTEQGRNLRVVSHDVFSITFDDGAGFTYLIEPHNASVSYAFPVKFDGQFTDGKATARLGTAMNKYSVLFASLSTEGAWLLELLGSEVERQLTRLGFMANATIPAGSLPPGAQDLVDLLGSPWGRPPTTCASKFLVELASREGEVDQCHHQIEFEELATKGARLVLDWQRVFTRKLLTRSSALDGLVSNSAADAYNYFNRFGEGSFK